MLDIKKLNNSTAELLILTHLIFRLVQFWPELTNEKLSWLTNEIIRWLTEPQMVVSNLLTTVLW